MFSYIFGHKMALSRLDNFEDRLERRRRICRIPTIRLRDRDNPLENYNALQFKARFHIYKETALYITSLISPEIFSSVKRGVHIPPIIQLLATVRYFSTGSFQLCVADLHGISQPTVSKIIKRVSLAIAKRRRDFIKFPKHRDAVKYREEFFSMSGFPGNVLSIHK